MSRNASRSLENAMYIEDERVARAYYNERASVYVYAEQLDWTTQYEIYKNLEEQGVKLPDGFSEEKHDSLCNHLISTGRRDLADLADYAPDRDFQHSIPLVQKLVHTREEGLDIAVKELLKIGPVKAWAACISCHQVYQPATRRMVYDFVLGICYDK